KEALHPIAAGTSQDFELAHILDAFGDNLHPQRVRESSDRVDDRRGLVVVLELTDERAVDLDRVDRQVSQITDRRISGTEIVDGDLDAKFLERVQLPYCARVVVDERGLGDFERDRRWVDLRRFERLAHALGKVGLVELATRD